MSLRDHIFLSKETTRLYHYGTPQMFDFDPHGSGRYRQGTGNNPNQRDRSFAKFYLDNVKKYGSEAVKEAWGYNGNEDIPVAEMNSILFTMARDLSGKTNPETGKRYTYTEIAHELGMSTTEYRKMMSAESNKVRAANITRAKELQNKGFTPNEIAEQMNESPNTVRSWLIVQDDKINRNRVYADYLKEQVEEKKYLDVGKGVEAQLGMSAERLGNVVKLLEDEGYHIEEISVPQTTDPKKKINMQILVKDGVDRKEVWDNRELIRSPKGVWYDDEKHSMRDVIDPVSVDSKRIEVKYANEGGLDNDGLIELRPGVEDIALGSNHYAQVRIAVDGTHYMKGMAVYSDDLPKGIDIRVYSNKAKGTPLLGEDNEHSVLKNMKKNKQTGEIDEENPFGSTIRQFEYDGADGKRHQSAINLVNTEEDYAKWATRLSKQYLMSQPASTIKRQLDLLYLKHKDEWEEISDYPNKTIRKELLNNLANECDSDAVHLYAAKFANQSVRIILPESSLKDNECYCPGYETGTKVIAIRYPNQGPWEVPVLTVNNNNKEAKKRYGQNERAFVVNGNVRQQMSGADCDGDTAAVAPVGDNVLKTMPAFKSLLNFEPKVQYAWHEGMIEPDKIGKAKKNGGDGFNTQLEMGKIANLIMDMRAMGASEVDDVANDMVKATKYAQTVIDAEKHHLDWQQAKKDCDIDNLRKKYRGSEDGGAATLLTRNKHTTEVNERSPGATIDPETGRLIYRDAKGYYDRETGTVKYRKDHPYVMTETRDAYNLVSRGPSGETTLVETIYADHANRLMALADDIRKEIARTPDTPMSREARTQYPNEYESLRHKLRVAEMNAPNERLAQAAASKKVAAIKDANPGLSKKEEKKIRSQIIKAARRKAGAIQRDERVIHPTDREWEALVSGVLSKEQTKAVIGNMKTEDVLERTFPREKRAITPAKLARAKALYRNGNGNMSLADVAKEIGVNPSTLRDALNGK